MSKPNWTPIQIRLGEIEPWQHNPRQSDKRARAALLSTLDEFGQPVPFIVGPKNSDGKYPLYDAHQRYLAWLPKFGAAFVVAAMMSDRPLTEDERKKYVIQFHASTVGNWNADELSTWDTSLIDVWANIPEITKGWKSDIKIFDELHKSEQPGADAEPQTDRAAELLEKWQVQPGDLFAIGEHRLICGDCTDAATVARVMGGEKAELLFTSPPYSDMREYTGDGDLSLENLVRFIPTFYECCDYQVINLGLQRKDNEVYEYWNEYIKAAKDCGYKLLSWNVWNREGGGFSMQAITAMFAIQHEWIFVFGKSRKDLNLTVPNQRAGRQSDPSTTVRQRDGSTTREDTDFTIRPFRQLSTVQTIMQEQSRVYTKFHPAIFPVSLPEEYIKAMTNDGDVVAEPFSGSGTTLVACENLGRRCRAIEISPAYVAVALERMSQAFPGIDIHRLDAGG
jgi:DNA modification methylase